MGSFKCVCICAYISRLCVSSRNRIGWEQVVDNILGQELILKQLLTIFLQYYSSFLKVKMIIIAVICRIICD